MTDEDIIEGEIVETGIELHQSAAPATLFGTNDPESVLARAAETSTALKRFIEDRKLIVRISGKDHPLVEAWVTLGSILGVFPVVVWTRKLENGWEARVEARTMAGGVVGAAEAECLRSENRWRNADDYAIRSMAQTRATSKALRGPLGYIMHLAGYDPTPAEEMPEPSKAGSPTAGTGASSPPLSTSVSAPSSGEEAHTNDREASGQGSTSEGVVGISPSTSPEVSAPAVGDGEGPSAGAASPARCEHPDWTTVGVVRGRERCTWCGATRKVAA